MACINQGKPISPRVKFKTIQKIKEQEYITEQAYLIPENDGTAIYLSYELNKSLENIFKRYSINGYMGVNEFIKMCYDYNLLPQNKNKDILHYIFKSPKSSKNGYIEYKDFFQILHRLSGFLFRKLIMTEQEKFNVLIKHLTALKFSKEVLKSEKYNVGIQVSIKKQTVGINAVCVMTNSSCNTNVDVKNEGTMTDITEIKINEDNKEEKKSEELNTNNINCTMLKSRSFDEIEIKEKINEMEKKCIQKEEVIKKLKEEISNALKMIEEKNIEIENINKNNLNLLEIERKKITELKSEIKKLQEEKNDLEKKQKEIIEDFENREQLQLTKKEESKKIDMEYLELKRLLFLSGEEESVLMKIFSLYSTYNGEIVEYVMDKKRCANFLVTYYLLRKNGKNEKNINLNIENAENLFNEILNKRKYIEGINLSEDVFTYFYFKLLLCNIGMFMYPELSKRESFLEIVLNHILFLNKNEDIINGKEKNTKIKKKSKIKTKGSNEIEVFTGNIIGRYTSSDKSTNSNDFKKKREKKKLENDEQRLILQQMKPKNCNTDQSFEYIESNKTKKKKKNDKKKNKEGKAKEITNYLKQNIEYKGTYGYDTSSEDCISINSINSDYLHYGSWKNNIIQTSKIKDTFMKIPEKVLNGSKIANTNNINFQNILPLYDIEGKIWSSKSEKKKNFIPIFGNE
ncbi:conserved Plasmodium protein, unknown function [Plasmodium gallinaceum]|uniref:Uncharacterized protein n=1 Tax=Plasmodium gallinaceum TaxID=5849 RepID=A0A1J1GZA3_PLAGA|nr:conserved Plasmodium protein, unknown function [Plasmodium gallinaceum]CRG97776.1 conserved Plasmodium protein, unknown function [Plasmodium gallinaceum]